MYEQNIDKNYNLLTKITLKGLIESRKLVFPNKSLFCNNLK